MFFLVFTALRKRANSESLPDYGQRSYPSTTVLNHNTERPNGSILKEFLFDSVNFFTFFDC